LSQKDTSDVSVNLWEQVFRGLPDPIAVLDRDGRILRANQALADRLGLDVDSCTGQLCSVLFHGRDGFPPGCPHAALLKDGQAHTAEVPLERLGGEFVVSTFPRVDAGGAIVGSVHVAHDVTDRVRAERALEASEKRLMVALESVGLGVFDWDLPSGRVLYVDPGQPRTGGETLGYRETDARGWAATTHPDDVAAAERAVAQALSGEAEGFVFVSRRQFEYYRANEVRHVESRGRVLERDAEGRALRVVGTFEDVTDVVRREQVDREKQAALDHATRVASLGVLASSLAHEVNQPLAALSGYVQAAARLLDAGPARHDEARAALSRSVELAEKAAEIIKRSRRLARRVPPLRERVDLGAVLADVSALLAREAGAAGVELQPSPRGTGPFLVGDRVQIEQVLTNLVRNGIEAAQAAPAGRRRVAASARQIGPRVEIAVSDTGPGVPPDVAARIFEPFFTTKAGGTGLGLVIAETIAEAHGGRIRLERTGAEGTSFVVTLPVAGEEAGGAER
jgi:PAS domain S-box-containing protein